MLSRVCGQLHKEEAALQHHALDQKALRRLRTLSWLSNNQLERLVAEMPLSKIRKSDSIFSEGAVSDQVYLLVSGVAKLSFLNPEGERVLVGLVGPGEIFGVSSMLPQIKRPFSCDAFSDCVVGTVPASLFVEVVFGHSAEYIRQAMDATVGRWWGMLLRYTNFLSLGLKERLASALRELAGRFGVQDSRGTIITLRLTHADLAELVGASRQRITEQLSEFERAGIIARDGRRLIVVQQRLEELGAL